MGHDKVDKGDTVAIFLPHLPTPNELITHELIIHLPDTVISWFSTSS
ncbi:MULTISPECIES: hypothetical protein [Nostoc]|uniref:Uncharacterized protein n=1 Tax=Nostoc paludosum FACHB-159 TaxID=2692908 RepID=A0ABR8KCE5_9NOSO|nr:MULTISPECIES: hypothetical protein [Nostoc]MBD2680693.1 hypothetical protein [Nostoc sp. FACHB-857]MBD2737203.1 hypothetical protein [Nostoc paludosum FACHB-159]